MSDDRLELFKGEAWVALLGHLDVLGVLGWYDHGAAAKNVVNEERWLSIAFILVVHRYDHLKFTKKFFA